MVGQLLDLLAQAKIRFRATTSILIQCSKCTYIPDIVSILTEIVVSRYSGTNVMRIMEAFGLKITEEVPLFSIAWLSMCIYCVITLLPRFRLTSDVHSFSTLQTSNKTMP